MDASARACTYIDQVSADSPFAAALSKGDLLLSATLPAGKLLEFGNANGQRTPGVLVYFYGPIQIDIAYIKATTKQRVDATVVLSNAYADVSPVLDGPLQTGLLSRPSKLLLGCRTSLPIAV